MDPVHGLVVNYMLKTCNFLLDFQVLFTLRLKVGFKRRNWIFQFHLWILLVNDSLFQFLIVFNQNLIIGIQIFKIQILNLGYKSIDFDLDSLGLATFIFDLILDFLKSLAYILLENCFYDVNFLLLTIHQFTKLMHHQFK